MACFPDLLVASWIEWLFSRIAPNAPNAFNRRPRAAAA
jgi:hypothetical protein